ncbi:MAG TPA: JAB domain-containing protein [bacterium]|nr:JAB domain-containing protein [bacterium]
MIDKIRETAYYHTKIKDWPEDERPREKLLACGPHALGDAELLALLIGSGTGGVTAVDVAKRMLIEHGDLSGMASATSGELSRMKGVGPARGARILAAFELGRRVEGGGRRIRIRIQAPGDVFRIYAPILGALRREVFKVLLLDSGNRLIRDVTVSEGILNASVVHPREVFKCAVDYLAAGIILSHNHPSGESCPSAEDKRITHQLVRAGEILGIPVLDHIIITPERYFSFSENKLLSAHV